MATSDSSGGVALRTPSRPRSPTPPSSPKPAASASPAVKKPQLTHFLTIPLHHAPRLQSAIDDFAANVPKDLEISPRCIRPAICCHLTLAVMALNDETLKAAVQLLKETDLQEVLRSSTKGDPSDVDVDSAPLQITLKGLQTMGPSAKKSKSLYAPPTDSSGRLQPFGKRLRELFTAAGFAERELERGKERKLKLHCTLLNTIYGPRVRVAGKAKKRQKVFDATALLEANKERVWADGLVVDKVAICKMSAADKDGVKGGAGYEAVAWKGFDGEFGSVTDRFR